MPRRCPTRGRNAAGGWRGRTWSSGPFRAPWRLPVSLIPRLERAWDAWQAERYQRGVISQRPGSADNPFGPR
jgi:hypothetical protein